jgi:hypothetical protein
MRRSTRCEMDIQTEAGWCTSQGEEGRVTKSLVYLRKDTWSMIQVHGMRMTTTKPLIKTALTPNYFQCLWRKSRTGHQKEPHDILIHIKPSTLYFSSSVPQYFFRSSTALNTLRAMRRFPRILNIYTCSSTLTSYAKFCS